MIGVIANPDEHSVIREFFELFKTPWELYRSDRRYDVVLSTTGEMFDRDAAKLLLVYSGQQTPFDAEQEIKVSSRKDNSRVFSYKGNRLPLYRTGVTFHEEHSSALVDEGCQLPAMFQQQSGGGTWVRIGYNLFGEVGALLTAGQPIANAAAPTLDLHISLLRDLIVESGVPLVEIPPVPDGYPFIACLTHDVDHPSIRAHKFDHTALGFLYRAVVGSVVNLLRGRSGVRHLLTNWLAAAKLLFVQIGLADDFWSGFDDYLKLEAGCNPSYFVIPFKNKPGRTATGTAPSARGSAYGAADIAGDIQKLVAAGSEVGVHGIDSWIDSASGKAERDEIRKVAGNQTTGIRMHWLYFDNDQSHLTLEKAGFEFDSTVGYNGNVGYRAGTSQVYKPLPVARLLELPLHIMDTALFFPSHLNLSSTEARKRVDAIFDNAAQSGGTVTINWHDRSMAPERQWGDFYAGMVADLKKRGAWFSSASQAVSWFRKRRAVVFEEVSRESGELQVKISRDAGENLPGLRLRIYNAQAGSDGKSGFRDKPLKESMEVCVAVAAASELTEGTDLRLLSKRP